MFTTVEWKKEIFIYDQDRRTFLSKLFGASIGEIEVAAYCLMNNHYHLLVHQVADYGLSRCMKSLGIHFTKYFNKKYDRVGSLFGSTYQMKYVQTNSQLLHLSRYIHLNPVKERIEKHAGDDEKISELLDVAEQYKWSSYYSYIHGRKLLNIDADIVLDQFKHRLEYKKFVDMHAHHYIGYQSINSYPMSEWQI